MHILPCRQDAGKKEDYGNISTKKFGECCRMCISGSKALIYCMAKFMT